MVEGTTLTRKDPRMEMERHRQIIELMKMVCGLSRDVFEKEIRSTIARILRRKISNHEKVKFLLSPMLEMLSYQGTADSAADSYMENHGVVTFDQIALQLALARRRGKMPCPKLESFEAFSACGFRKTSRTCNNQDAISRCPLPHHDMMKGILNQKAYSLFLFIRDECQGDLVGWIDSTIGKYSDLPDEADRITKAKDDLVEYFTSIVGVGHKLASMTLSSLLIGDPKRPHWQKVGQAMIAIDSLVHNFLHRTGILEAYDSSHRYGPACFTKCVKVIEDISRSIDASQFNPAYPPFFPRFVQIAIWRFCAQNGEDICNGRNIDDSSPCDRNDLCPVYDLFCGRVPLHSD